jgi:hypothetical protein
MNTDENFANGFCLDRSPFGAGWAENKRRRCNCLPEPRAGLPRRRDQVVGKIHAAMKQLPRRRGALRKAIFKAAEEWNPENAVHSA